MTDVNIAPSRELPRRFLSIEQLREMLGNRSASSIHRDVEEGRLPKPMKMGVRRYWLESEV